MRPTVLAAKRKVRRYESPRAMVRTVMVMFRAVSWAGSAWPSK